MYKKKQITIQCKLAEIKRTFCTHNLKMEFIQLSLSHIFSSSEFSPKLTKINLSCVFILLSEMFRRPEAES